MNVERETACYQWAYDSLYGVGRFVRKADNAITLLETGSDCDELREHLEGMSDADFDATAEGYEFVDGEPVTDKPLPVYYDCGICGHFHPIDFGGDCRYGNQAFTHDDLESRHGELDKDFLIVEPCQHCGAVGPDIDGDCGCEDEPIRPVYEGPRLPGMIDSLADIEDGSDFGEFLSAYIRTALWASTDERDPNGGDPIDDNYGPEDLHPDALKTMREDCEAFWSANHQHISEETCLRYGPDFGPIGHAGHDFWLTRCGHGAGFWDGDWRESEETILAEASKAFGECHLYVGDDGLIYSM